MDINKIYNENDFFNLMMLYYDLITSLENRIII